MQLRAALIILLLLLSSSTYARSFPEHCLYLLSHTGLVAPPIAQAQIEDNILKAIAGIEKLKMDLLKDPFHWSNIIDNRVDIAELKASKQLTALEIAQSIHVPEWSPIVDWIEAYLQHDMRLPNLDKKIKKSLQSIFKFSKKVRQRGYIYADILALSSLHMLSQEFVTHEELLGRVPTLKLKFNPQQISATASNLQLQKERAKSSSPQSRAPEDLIDFSADIQKYIFKYLDVLGFPYQIPIPFPTDLNELEITQLWSAGLHPLGQVPRWVREESFSVAPKEWWLHDLGHSILAFAALVGVDTHELNNMSTAQRDIAVRNKLAALSKNAFRASLRAGGYKLWTQLKLVEQNETEADFRKFSHKAYDDLHEFVTLNLTAVDEWLKGTSSPKLSP